MKTEFILYEQALALKELGFDESCIAKYNSWGTLFIREEPEPSEKEVLAPLYQQAFRWLFEKRGIKGCMIMDDTLDAVLNENIKLLKKKNEQSK